MITEELSVTAETVTEAVTEAASKGDKLSIGDAAVTAVFGYAVVFFGLVTLMVLLYITGAYFKSRDAKAKAEAEKNKKQETPQQTVAPVAEQKLAPGSAGHIKLNNVSDKEAAMIMAIVADKMQTPLNELHFISIKEVK